MTPQLFVHRDVVDHLGQLPARPYEVGGWLLGFWAEDDSAVFITHATPPGARGTPFGVHISGRGHRRLFDAAWDVSDGAITFLGDWHTHPGCPPLPSDQDQKAMTKLATRKKYGTALPLMAILGTARWPWTTDPHTLALYVRGRDGKLAALQLIVTDEMPPEGAAVPSWPWRARRQLQGHMSAAPPDTVRPYETATRP